MFTSDRAPRCSRAICTIMSDPGPSRRRIIVTGPEDALSHWQDAHRPRSEEPRPRALLTLPHPRSGVPAYFLPYSRGSDGAHENLSSQEKGKGKGKDGISELVGIKPDATLRSWFLTHEIGSDEPSTLKLGQPADEERVADTVIGGEFNQQAPV